MDFVIDTNVLIHGRGKEFDECYTVPEVLDEARSSSAERGLIANEIKVESPDDASFEKVKKLSGNIFSPTSETDEILVALALEKNAKIVSDDKAVQNLAKHLGVPYQSFNDQEIEKKREWKKICPSCGQEIEGFCERCGKEPIRKPV